MKESVEQQETNSELESEPNSELESEPNSELESEKIKALILEITKGVEARKQHHKTDAYFDLPKDITVDEIKLLQRIIETDQLGCRLYDRYQLQVYWKYRPRKNQMEFLSSVSAMHDIDQQILFFEQHKCLPFL